MNSLAPVTFHENETEEGNHDRALWCAVLRQAVIDATQMPSATAPKRVHAEKRQARAWLTKNSEDFRDVCHLAGMDPEAVREHAVRVIATAEIRAPRVETARRERKSRVPNPNGRKPSVFIEHQGHRLSLNEWSARLGIPRATIVDRRNRGLSTEAILGPSLRRPKADRGVGRAQTVNAGTGALTAAQISA